MRIDGVTEHDIPMNPIPAMWPGPLAGAQPEPAAASTPETLSSNLASRTRKAIALSALVAAITVLLAVAAGVVPVLFGLRPFVVISGSMEPTISTGSIAITRPVKTNELETGDVIAFNPSADNGLPIVHRIVKIEERNGIRYFTTRGDANTGDDAEVALPSTSLKLIGAVPFVGYAVFYAAQPIGTVMLVWIPLCLLAALWLKDRIAMAWRSRAE